MEYLFLTVLLGFVQRLFSILGISKYTSKYETKEEMAQHLGFHLLIINYIIGSIIMYSSITFVAALFIKNYIL